MNDLKERFIAMGNRPQVGWQEWARLCADHNNRIVELEKERDEAIADRNKQFERFARLRAAIRDAPCGMGDSIERSHMVNDYLACADGEDGLCSCWKREVLGDEES